MFASRTTLFRALIAGLAAASALAGCGSSDTPETAFIAESRAQRMVSALDRVERDLTGGDCERAATNVGRVREEVADLPDRTDTELVANLMQWVDHLEQRVPDDCVEQEEEEEETPTPTPTEEPEETATPEATETPEATVTPEPTVTPVPTAPPEEGGEGGGGDEEGGGGGGEEPPSTGGVVPEDG